MNIARYISYTLCVIAICAIPVSCFKYASSPEPKYRTYTLRKGTVVNGSRVILYRDTIVPNTEGTAP